MKKLLTVILATIMVIVFCNSNKLQAQTQKFAHINSQQLLSAMPEVNNLQEKLKKFEDSLNIWANELATEIQEKDSIIAADSSKWAPAKKELKIKEANNLKYEFSKLQNTANQILEQKYMELLEPIKKIAFDAIQKVAKDNGYTYVFSSEALMVAPPGDDLLAKVKAQLKIVDKPSGGK